MALATYSDLQTSIANWLKRTDLTAIIPDFISLAEARIARDLRLRAQVTATTLTTVAGTQAVTLPSNFLDAENITLSSVTPAASLSVVTPEILDRRYPSNYGNGQPTIYCVIGSQLLLGPTPDGVYSISLDYYQRFAALSATPTNWLLTNHPNIYLFAALAEGAPYLMEDERSQLWEAKYRGDVAVLQQTDDAAVRSGSAMRVRTL